jgi:hypothetical protein
MIYYGQTLHRIGMENPRRRFDRSHTSAILPMSFKHLDRGLLLHDAKVKDNCALTILDPDQVSREHPVPV